MECHCLFADLSLILVILLNVVLLYVILLNVILLNVILLNVILLNVILLNVILLYVMAPYCYFVSDDLPKCMFGLKCYRRNPNHFQSFSHPHLDQLVPTL
jgi:hypothetical protein